MTSPANGAKRAAMYNNEARSLLARLKEYEDVHPDDAVCLSAAYGEAARALHALPRTCAEDKHIFDSVRLSDGTGAVCNCGTVMVKMENGALLTEWSTTLVSSVPLSEETISFAGVIPLDDDRPPADQDRGLCAYCGAASKDECNYASGQHRFIPRHDYVHMGDEGPFDCDECGLNESASVHIDEDTPWPPHETPSHGYWEAGDH